MDYKEHFMKHYADWLSEFSASSLIEVINNLEQLIDSELYDDCLLSDEICMLYDIARDECVKRIALSCEPSV